MDMSEENLEDSGYEPDRGKVKQRGMCPNSGGIVLESIAPVGQMTRFSMS